MIPIYIYILSSIYNITTARLEYMHNYTIYIYYNNITAHTQRGGLDTYTRAGRISCVFEKK